MSSFMNIAIIAGIVLVCVVFVLVILTRLYRRASKETSFVRTGMGGQKVIMDGGALVLPVLHEIILVNMTTLKLPVSRKQKQALITMDRLRVDVDAEFFVRVKPEVESISAAAQTLGSKTMNPDELRSLIEGKFVDALRSVAASMEMNSLHEQRADFVQKVQNVVSNDILKNGLELESVSLTGLDQTNKNDLDPNNAFDAEGLAKLTTIIESRRKLINDTEQETRVEIETKNLNATQRSLQIRREQEYAEIETEREIANRRAEQQASIAQVEAERRQQAETARLTADRQIEGERLAKDQAIATREVEKDQAIAARDIEKRQAIELAEQGRQIAVAERSRDESSARAEAERARAEAVRATEQVDTARAEEQANRAKSIELIKASEEAERAAIGITVAAKAERSAAEDRAAALTTEAKAKSGAEMIAAEGTAATYKAEAEGKMALNNAENSLSSDVIALRLREALLRALPDIIAAASEPLKNIDSIRVVDVNGFNGLSGNGGATNADGVAVSGGSLSDQVVSAALRHRTAAPLLDGLMAEVGLNGASLNGLLAGAQDAQGASKPATAKPAVAKPAAAQGAPN